MTLDIQTVLLVLLANVIGSAIALPLLMGWHVSKAARFFQLSAVVQALGWLAFLAAPHIHDRGLSTVSIALLSLSFVLVWSALDEWLGKRPGRRLMLLLAVATPIGYGLSHADYPFRVGWSNAGLALQMLIVCVAVAKPAPQASWRWRGLVFSCIAALAVVTLWRGVLGAFFTEAYPFYRSTHPVNVAAALMYHVALALMTLGFLAAWREEAERKLRRQAQTDGLTGLPNRQTFAEHAAFALAHANRYDEPLSVVMIDIDHFKRVNDRFGHAVGDIALQTLARGLRDCTRATDLVCRYGGEEFCVLLTRARVAEARHFDERLRHWLAANSTQSTGPEIGYSAGVAERQDSDKLLDDLMRRADAALYQAKAAGRARMVEAPTAVQQAELKFEAASETA